jgi:hypothetical protein
MCPFTSYQVLAKILPSLCVLPALDRVRDEMVSKEEFDSLETDFIASQEFVDIAEESRHDMKFVCHHNAYLVAGFLQRRGHEGLYCVSGYYRCRGPENRIHHSWIKLIRDEKTVAIFELDPKQLHEEGCYENDLMPSGYIPEMSMTISGAASIVDPDLVELSEATKESRWVVSSREILLRYIEDAALVPQIDFDDLDEIGIEAQEVFDEACEFRNENDSA